MGRRKAEGESFRSRGKVWPRATFSHSNGSLVPAWRVHKSNLHGEGITGSASAEPFFERVVFCVMYVSAKYNICWYTMAENITRAFTMNMPVNVHKALRQEVFERETSMGEIVVEALLKWSLKPSTEEGTSK